MLELESLRPDVRCGLCVADRGVDGPAVGGCEGAEAMMAYGALPRLQACSFVNIESRTATTTA